MSELYTKKVTNGENPLFGKGLFKKKQYASGKRH